MQEDIFAHTPQQDKNPQDEQPAPLAEASIFDLIRAFQNVLKRFDEARDFGDIVDDRFTVSDKIEFLMNHLKPGEALSLQGLFEKATSKVEVIVTFLALLELMKMNLEPAKMIFLAKSKSSALPPSKPYSKYGTTYISHRLLRWNI